MRTAMDPIHEQSLKHLHNTLTGKLRQAFEASKAWGTRYVLTVRPNRPDTVLTDIQMIHVIRTRMGIGITEFHGLHHQTRHQQCRACNKPGCKAAPEHMLSCAYTRIKRHDAVVVAVQNAIMSAGVNSQYEHNTGPSQRIDLLLHHPAPESANQTKMMIDVTVLESYPYKTDVLPKTQLKLQTANTNKIQKYKNVATQLNASVQPLAFTTLGAMSVQTREFFKELQRMAQVKHQYFPDVDRSFQVVWQENIAFGLARATTNYACIAADKHRKLQAHTTSLQQ